MDSIDKFLEDSECDYGEEESIHPPIVVNRDELGTPHHDDIIENAKDDYEFVRTNIKQVIETNVKALEGLAKVAQQSESPRAYEVLSAFMKQMVDANESLIGLHKNTKEITDSGKSGDETPQGNVTNNHYYGSTEDFLTELEREDAEGKVIDVDVNEES